MSFCHFSVDMSLFYYMWLLWIKNSLHGFPGSSVVKNVPANAGDTSLIPDHGAAKPMCRKYWACALEPRRHNCWTHVLQLLKPAPCPRVPTGPQLHHTPVLRFCCILCLERSSPLSTTLHPLPLPHAHLAFKSQLNRWKCSSKMELREPQKASSLDSLVCQALF